MKLTNKTMKLTNKIIARILREAVVTHEPIEEDIRIEDSFQFPDDIAEAHRLARLSPWGWCCVVTTVEYRGFTGVTSLGGNSYASREDWERDQGAQQAEEAVRHLWHKFDVLKEQVSKANAVMRELATDTVNSKTHS